MPPTPLERMLGVRQTHRRGCPHDRDCAPRQREARDASALRSFCRPFGEFRLNELRGEVDIARLCRRGPPRPVFAARRGFSKRFAQRRPGRQI
jgi:hypothetical protein